MSYHNLLILSFLLTFTTLNSLSLKESEGSNLPELVSIINTIDQFFRDKAGDEFVNNTNYLSCKDIINNTINVPNSTSTIVNISSLLSNAFLFSGKGISDLGNELSCTQQQTLMNSSSDASINDNNVNGIQSRLYYHTLEYQIDYEKLSDTEDKNVIHFLAQKQYYTGVCIPQECTALLRELLFNKTTNSKFVEYIENYLGYFNISVVRSKPFTELKDPDRPFQQHESSYAKSYKIFRGFVIFYFIMKVLMMVLRIMCYGSRYKYATVIVDNKNEKDNKDLAKDPDIDFLGIRAQVPPVPKTTQIFTSNADSQTKEIDEKDFPCFLKVVKFLDISDSLSHLISEQTRLFSDDGIEPLVFIRIILMFLSVFNHNIYTLLKIPAKDFLNPSFYTSFAFFLVKLSIHNSTCWIILEAAFTSYKLMSFIKKEMRSKGRINVYYRALMKFFVYTVPKIITFIIIYYFFTLCAFYYGELAKSVTLFRYLTNNILLEKECYSKGMFSSLFKVPYLKYGEPFFSNCFKFVNIYLNEFYCFIILTIYLFIAYTIKSKYLDLIFTICIFINFCLSPLSMTQDLSKELYTVDYVLGHAYNEKYTHLFINYYVFGILVGMCYFYYHDAVTKDSICQRQEEYFPFSFCFSIVKVVDLMGNILKGIIFYLSIIIMFLLSTTYYFIRRNTSEGETQIENKLVVNFGTFITFIYKSEKMLFAVAFCVFLLFLFLHFKEGTFKHICKSGIVMPFNRSAFVFYCISDMVIYFSYCVFTFKLSLTYQNLTFLTIGLLIIISIIGFIFTVMFELPLRIMVKYFMRDTTEKLNPRAVYDKERFSQSNNNAFGNNNINNNKPEGENIVMKDI